MKTLIGLIIIIISGCLFLLYLLYHIIADKVKILFGYKKYEYTKILSHGMKNVYMWHKTDEEALKFYTHFEFVSQIKPETRQIRPL